MMKYVLEGESFSPQVNIGEAIRYLGYGSATPDDSVMALLNECALQLQSAAVPRFLCLELELLHKDGRVYAGDSGIPFEGEGITSHLKASKKGVLMCATLGGGADRLINKLQLTSPQRGVIADACANSLIEALCDSVQAALFAKLCDEDEQLTFRYSPGYGDFPLSSQTWLLRLLDSQRKIGLCETESHFLTPLKSVTAVIGVTAKKLPVQQGGCNVCDKKDTCIYRKRGATCGL